METVVKCAHCDHTHKVIIELDGRELARVMFGDFLQILRLKGLPINDPPKPPEEGMN